MLAPWESHNNGSASKILCRMGYTGGGLGRHGEGITSPIDISSGTRLHRNGIGSPPRVENKVHPWPPGTTLIAGDSILCGVDESRLERYNAKVRAFKGASIDDMYDYLKPLLMKNPSVVVLHVGTNDVPTKSCDEIYKELRNLEEYIEMTVPRVKVYFSTPTVRTDNTKANATLVNVTKKLKKLCLNLVTNDNIIPIGVGKRGLHLNEKGSGRLALNYIDLMRRV